MTSAAPTATTTQVYRVWIKATPEAIWDAITSPEWTQKYGYGGIPEYDLSPGVPDVIVDGEILESDPPRKLSLTWRMLMDPGMAAEGFTTVTYEIAPTESAGTRLTIFHDLEGAPALAAMVAGDHEAEGAGGGWAWVLSDLKSLLETGQRLAN